MVDLGKDDDSQAEELVETQMLMLRIGEQMQPILDAVVGHKQQAIQRGFSEQAAELMAASYHNALVQQMLVPPRRR